MLDLSFSRCNQLNHEALKKLEEEKEEFKKEESKKGDEDEKPIIKRLYYLPEKFEDWKSFSWPKEILENAKKNN